MRRRDLLRGSLAGSVALATARIARGQDDVYRLKLSSYVPPVHHQHAIIFVQWAEELARRSNGRLQLELYPAEQLGRMSQQYNIVRRGDVDFSFVLHGIPAGRFPLVELTHLPMLFRSGEQAAQVLMELLPDYLAAEHRGVKVLYIFGHSPGSLHTSSRAVRVPGDLQGLRIRHPSSVVGDTLKAWGASPAGMPVSELAGNLEKGVIDGLAMPYDGVLSFRLAPYIRYTTELFSYVNSFALMMNERTYDNLPDDLRQLIDDTTGKEVAREVGVLWDSMEGPGREYMESGGVEVIEMTDAERQVFADAAEHVFEERIAQAEADGLPAREFMARLRELTAQF